MTVASRIAICVSVVIAIAAILPLRNAINGALAVSDQTKAGLHGAATNTLPGIPWFDILSPKFGPTSIFMNANENMTCQDLFDGLTVHLVPKNDSWQNGREFEFADFEAVDAADGKMTPVKDCDRGSRGGFANIYTAIAQVPYPSCKANPCKYSIIGDDGEGEPDFAGTVADFRYDIQCPAGMGCWGLNRHIIDKTKDTLGNLYTASWFDLNLGAGLLAIGVLGLIAACLVADKSALVTTGQCTVIFLISCLFLSRAVNQALAKSDETRAGLHGAATNTLPSIPWFDILDPMYGPTTIFMNANENMTCGDLFAGLTVSLVPKNAAWQNGVDFNYADFNSVDNDGKMAPQMDCAEGSQGGFANIYTGIAQVPYPECTADPCPYGIIGEGADGEPDFGGTVADFRYDIQCPVGMGCWGLNRHIIDKTKDVVNNFYDAAAFNVDVGGPLLILALLGCCAGVAAFVIPDSEHSGNDQENELIES